MRTARAYVADANTAPAFWQIGNLWRVMATGVQTDNSFCLVDQLVTDDGGGPCTHTHPQDEGLYVVSGHCTFNAGGKTVKAGAGSFVAVPRRTEHSFVVDAPGTQLLNFYLPAGFELILMGLAAPAEQNTLPPPGAVKMPPRHLVEQLSRNFGQGPVLGLPFADPPSATNMRTRPTPGARALPFMSQATDAPSYWHMGGLWSVLADSEQTDGSYTLIEQLMSPGPQAPPHVHEKADEVFYILDGEAEFLLSDRLQKAGSGALIFIPRGMVHGFRVTSDRPCRALNLYTPGGFERTLPAFAQRTETRTLPAPDWRGPDVPEDQRNALFADLSMFPIAVPNPFGAS
jgi:quercetin dioxygenase-like cupin family protein